MEKLYELEDDLELVQAKLIQGYLEDSFGVRNNCKEEVLKLLEGKVIELGKDNEKNFLLIETIKIFIEKNF